MSIFRIGVLLFLASLAQAQVVFPTIEPIGAVFLDGINPNTGDNYISVVFNSLVIQSAHFADVIVDISGTVIHTGAVDFPFEMDLLCGPEQGAVCPPPPYRYLSVQLQFNGPGNPNAGTVILGQYPFIGLTYTVYGTETFMLIPRLGLQYLVLPAIKPHAAGQALAVNLHKCPNTLVMPAGCYQ